MCSQRDLRVHISSDDDKNLTFKKKHILLKKQTVTTMQYIYKTILNKFS